MTSQLSTFIDTIKKHNGLNFFKSVGTESGFSRWIELGGEKFAEIYVSFSEMEVTDSADLTNEDEIMINELMDWIKHEIMMAEISAVDYKRTLNSLKYA